MEVVDENLVYKELERDDLEFFDFTDAKFKIFGLYEAGEYFNESLVKRMPQDIADKVNPGVAGHNRSAAGGRVCFITDSPTVAITTKVAPPHGANFSPISGSGYDIFVKEDDGKFTRKSVYRPKEDPSLPYSAAFGFDYTVIKPREMIINMPNYAGIEYLKIGVVKGSSIEPLTPYRTDIDPIVYYGSSITQGGCAGTPGNAYENIISRRNNIDFVNLGFSGNARGEQAMAEYIAGLKMSAFVLDYDHNAPGAVHYSKTHYAFYKTVRDANPNVPIIMITRPNGRVDPVSANMYLAVAKGSYECAKAAGDKNVYFINGFDLFGDVDPDICTVDGTHPNDLGFYRMAEVIGKVLDEALKNSNKK